jgi:Ribose/Galactose Isomerase
MRGPNSGLSSQQGGFSAIALNPNDDYPDFVIPLAWAVASGEVERGAAICGSGVGAAVCANKVPSIRAAIIHDHFSDRQYAVPTLDRRRYASATHLAHGAYILADALMGHPDVFLLASGSEVRLCLEAHEQPHGREYPSTSGEYAVVGVIRRPTAGIPRPRAPAAVMMAGGGSGLNLWLGKKRWHGGTHYWHAHVRCIGAAQGAPEEVRIRARPCGCGCKAATGQKIERTEGQYIRGIGYPT